MRASPQLPCSDQPPINPAALEVHHKSLLLGLATEGESTHDTIERSPSIMYNAIRHSDKKKGVPEFRERSAEGHRAKRKKAYVGGKSKRGRLVVRSTVLYPKARMIRHLFPQHIPIWHFLEVASQDASSVQHGFFLGDVLWPVDSSNAVIPGESHNLNTVFARLHPEYVVQYARP